MTDFGPCTCHLDMFATECASCSAWKAAQQAAGTRPRYVIHPGDIVSRNDGDRHFIGYVQLVQLYGCDPSDCVRYDSRLKYAETDIHLYPRGDGDYTIQRGVR